MYFDRNYWLTSFFSGYLSTDLKPQIFLCCTSALNCGNAKVLFIENTLLVGKYLTQIDFKKWGFKGLLHFNS